MWVALVRLIPAGTHICFLFSPDMMRMLPSHIAQSIYSQQSHDELQQIRKSSMYSILCQQKIEKNQLYFIFTM